MNAIKIPHAQPMFRWFAICAIAYCLGIVGCGDDDAPTDAATPSDTITQDAVTDALPRDGSPDGEGLRDAQMDSPLSDAGDTSDASWPTCVSPLPSFPEAEGWGAESVGGRGGQVLQVTTLDDTGPGSLRAAVEATGPRTVVFRVAGYITLESTLRITNPFITIAGHTAPGDGVALRQATGGTNRNQLLTIATHDVIVRGLRIRKGRADMSGCCDDGLETHTGAEDVIFDRCSIAWTQDGHIDLTNSRRVTVQRSMLTEALFGDGSNRNGKGLLVYSSDQISIHHNFFAHNYSRNPRVDSVDRVEVTNNIIYNNRSFGIELGNNFETPLRINVIGNYFRAGPNETPRFEILIGDALSADSVFVEDNYDDARNHPHYDAANPWAMVGICRAGSAEGFCLEPAPESHRVETAFDGPPLPVTRDGHATLPAWFEGGGAGALPHDAVDMRIMGHFADRTGGYVERPDDVGGYPELAEGTPYPDADADGMDDTWETAHGLDSNTDDSTADADDDGYTNLEEFLNGTDPNIGCVAP